MKIKNVYTKVRYTSTRAGAMGDWQTYEMGTLVEIYAPALRADDWYLVVVVGVYEDGTETDLSKVVIKR